MDTRSEASRMASPEIAYWRLLNELDQRELELKYGRDGPARYESWSPIRLDWDVNVWETAAREGKITIEFDPRYSQRGLVAELRRIWPVLIRCGVVRRTRPLTAKSQALVRLVCLVAPAGTTWAERRKIWNSKFARRHGRFDNDLVFQRDFRRAEEQVTGSKYGLEMFYSPIAQIDVQSRTGLEMSRLKEEGDKAAVAYLDRRSKLRRARAARSKKLEECLDKTKSGRKKS